MSAPADRYVIVGGNAAGMSAATRLRRLDESCEIVVFERDDHVSFASCGLPYHVSDTIPDAEQLVVESADDIGETFDLDIRTGHEVVDVDPEAQTITVESDGTRVDESYDDLVLTPGAEPIVPPIDGVHDADGVYTLRSVDDAVSIRERVEESSVQRALVVGAGYIGLEMAENLHEAGLDVAIAEMEERVMPHSLGPGMAALVHNRLREHGIDLHLNTTVDGIADREDGMVATFDDGSTVETGIVVLATGVMPRTELAEAAGVEIGDSGAIAVNEQLRTSNPHIYAAGDAVEVVTQATRENDWIPLAGPANRQGRVVADVLAGRATIYEPVLGTAVAKIFDMTVASVGETAPSLEARNKAYERSYTLQSSHADYYPANEDMRILLLFDPYNGMVLGAQIVGGEGVDKRIDVLATAIQHDDTVYDLQQFDLAYAPPYSKAKDPVNIAGMVAGNIVDGTVDTVHWDELVDLDEDVSILDCRPPEMRAERGWFDGSLNVPLSELRDRLDEIPDQVVTHCKIGKSAYFSARVLEQHGFDVRNLDGGYSFYNEIERDWRARDDPAYDPPIPPARE
ncbi:CoA-dependent NAD(P)H Sulfur Oxidoreductase [Halanaeroarchaeum sp. HSR-CO]|uniref:FAD-dependent oxidoreductase n=1 Tax=Halanaeroarchaeum sp. HSR-CO TaxID=2866382 RepID=UPI00217DBBF5|nr:FAD-dependent oxidoreductase [Halanaeroarchaeum sp. HSR-CO]UWG47846.1 CoA-dependent NAD(P)H Sulfur Oxidoreductase [Halanaeroarchaeum sp. HSR-CO]